MNTDPALADCPGGHRLEALSRVAAAMAASFDPLEVLDRGVEALVEATGAHCGEAYQVGPDGLELEVVRGCQGACPFQRELERIARRAAYEGTPVRSGGLVALPAVSGGRVRGVFGLSLPPDAADLDGCFLSAVGHLTALALDHAELVRELERRDAQRARLLRKWLSAQEEERRRVGQALHDEVGGILTGALLALRLAERDPEHLGEVREVLGQALDEVRRLSRELRPAALDDLGLERALERHLREFAQRTGLRVRPRLDIPRLERPVQLALFRIVQEALTNVARHAGATTVWVTLAPRDDRLWLEVRDDGAGFDPETTTPSLGLAGMRERAEQIEGTFRVETGPAQGTRIVVEVPLAGRAD
ncbi:MAG TPA: sensor histidine kinase [Oceanithermus profundus]|uniref:histidine kinase n=1 Tax=Oceanithermus profundus TaxID=187137 RepID=A0A7C4ZHB6_9DEIN|nr:sensor histidine kinase [Oceanithermus profundus]